GAIGLRVVDAGDVAGTALADAVVGEPEAAGAVEHDVVRRAQRMPVALLVERRDFAAAEIDALDRAVSGVRGGRWPGEREAHHLHELEAAAVVADVGGAVGADGRAVRSAAALGDDVDRPLLDVDSTQRAALDLDEHDAAVVHRDGAFGELESADDLSQLGHVELIAGSAGGFLELLGSHEDVARLGARRRTDDPALFEQIHQTPGTREPDAQLALQHRRRAELRAHDELHRLAQQVVVIVLATGPARSAARRALLGALHLRVVLHVGCLSPPLADDLANLFLTHPGTLDAIGRARG